MSNWYVYRHRRLDTNEIFYIGIGKLLNYKRAYCKSRRSEFWNNIVNKTNYDIEIIADKLEKDIACELEIFLIKEYGRKDLKLGPLVNLTNGGESTNGFVHSKEFIKRRTSKNIGIKRTEETKKKMSVSIKETLSKIDLKRSNVFKEKCKQRMLNSHPTKKKVICEITNKTWDSISKCAIDNNISKSHLSNLLNNKKINNTNLKFYNEN